MANRDWIDKPDWRIIAPQLNAVWAWASLWYDEQTGDERYLWIFNLVSATVLNFYNVVNDWPSFIWSPWLTWVFGAWASSVYMPSAWPRGTIASWATTKSFVPSASIGGTIPQNRLASRGIIWKWFRIRVIDNGVGGTGKTEEKMIVGNTAWTTPKIYLESDLSFTPVAWSSYELLSGRYYMLSAGLLAAWSFKYFDIALGIFSWNLSIANLPGTIATDGKMVVLDELYDPINKNLYEWFVGKLTTSTPTSTTINSSTTLPNTFADATTWVPINFFRNFQIRIVEDSNTPTAAGQRQIISSHTYWANPVFTIYSAWTVQPSNLAKFVIEYPNEIIFRTAALPTYSYAPFWVRNNALLTTPWAQADTWSNTRYWASTGTPWAGMMMFVPSGFPMGDATVDPLFLYKPGEIFQFRGWNTTALDILDIAGGAAWLWANTAPYMAIGTWFNTWSSIAYDPVGENGKFAYINLNATQFFTRFNHLTRDMCEYTYLRQTQWGALVWWRLFSYHAKNSLGEKIAAIWHIQSSGSLQHEIFITT